MAGPSSWYNDIEAKACVKICCELRRVAPSKSISIVIRYTEQRRTITKYLRNFDVSVRVLTSTGALGTQADVVLFSIVRNNPERIVGAVVSLQDLNGYSRSYDENHLIKQNCSRKLANLVDKKYGDVVQVSSRLSH
jgi:AAA domain